MMNNTSITRDLCMIDILCDNDYYCCSYPDDEKVNCEEFCTFMEKQLASGDPKEKLREAFDYYDLDKNGKIDRRELKRTFIHFYVACEHLSYFM
jgi:hypothetical protein